MTSLPMSSADSVLLEAALRATGGEARAALINAELAEINLAEIDAAQIGAAEIQDEQQLLRAFHSFAETATSLERSYASLREEVERLRRELEISHAGLAHSREENRALAEMCALLAHEVRNPLGGLELFAGLLAEAGLSPQCEEWIAHLQHGLKTLSATVNNMLQFHGAPSSERSALDLGSLLDGVSGFFAPLARRGNAEWILRNRLHGVLFSADRHQLEQVLLNLCLNALRAMPESGRLRLEGSREPDISGGAGTIAITVSDTGMGIDARHLSQIFQPGFTTRAGSPGLGLAVCRRIVEHHGGTIMASSRIGQGTDFTLRFPCSDHIENKLSMSNLAVPTNPL